MHKSLVGLLPVVFFAGVMVVPSSTSERNYNPEAAQARGATHREVSNFK